MHRIKNYIAQKGLEQKVKVIALVLPTPQKQFQPSFLAATVNGRHSDFMFKVEYLQNQWHLSKESLVSHSEGSVAGIAFLTLVPLVF